MKKPKVGELWMFKGLEGYTLGIILKVINEMGKFIVKVKVVDAELEYRPGLVFEFYERWGDEFVCRVMKEK